MCKKEKRVFTVLDELERLANEGAAKKLLDFFMMTMLFEDIRRNATDEQVLLIREITDLFNDASKPEGTNLIETLTT